MLGSATDAEDVLQDAWLRWQQTDTARIENPSAFLVRVVTRLAIDALGAARNRLTDYVGPWLPEPLVRTSEEESPESLRALAEDLSIAFLLLLERLSPVERAVFLLREPFDLSYREIAEVVGKSEAACRQIEHRARQRLNEEGGPPRQADPEEHGRLLSGFLHAVKDGDIQRMMALLADDAVLVSDGGGKARAALLPIYGSDRITRFFNSIVTKFGDAGIEARPAIVNGEPGSLNFLGGRLANVLSIQIEDGRIRRLFLVVNPDKLARLAQVAGGS